MPERVSLQRSSVLRGTSRSSVWSTGRDATAPAGWARMGNGRQRGLPPLRDADDPPRGPARALQGRRQRAAAVRVSRGLRLLRAAQGLLGRLDGAPDPGPALAFLAAPPARAAGR